MAGNTNNRGVVYAADVGGALHAISLTDGKGLWTLAVGRDPLVQAPGVCGWSVQPMSSRSWVVTMSAG